MAYLDYVIQRNYLSNNKKTLANRRGFIVFGSTRACSLLLIKRISPLRRSLRSTAGWPVLMFPCGTTGWSTISRPEPP